MDKLPSTKPVTTTTKKPTLRADGGRVGLRKLTDKEKEDIKKHIAKNNLDVSAARKLRFAQMKSAEGATVRTTINKLAKNQTSAKTKEQK